MKIALLLGFVVVATCLLEIDAGNSHLSALLKRLKARRTSRTSSVLANLKKKADELFKNKGYFNHGSKSKESDEESGDESDESEESQNQSKDLDKAFNTLYEKLCSATCKKDDQLCQRVLYRYVSPLCRYEDADKAAYVLRQKIGCSNLAYKVTLICKFSKRSRACKFAKKVKAFCDAGDTTTKPINSSTTSSTTSSMTSTTTTAATTSPIVVDPICDGFMGSCRDTCQSDETPFGACQTGGNCCVPEL